MAPPDSAGWSAPFAANAVGEIQPAAAAGMARYHLSASQAISWNIETVILWDLATTDPGFDVPSSGAVTFPTDGLYLIHAHIFWEVREARFYTVHIQTAASGVGIFQTKSDAHVLGPYQTGTSNVGTGHLHNPDLVLVDGTFRLTTSATDWGRFNSGDSVRATVAVDFDTANVSQVSVIGGGPEYSYLSILRLG